MKKMLSLLTAILLVASLTACSGGQGKSGSTTSGTPVKITILNNSGANDSNTVAMKYKVAQFNKQYAGKYEMVVEWVPGAAADLRSKEKLLNSSNTLPTIVIALGSEAAFEQLLVKNNRLVNLKPAFDSDKAWNSVCIPESIYYNTTPDNKMFTTPTSEAAYVGMYYNKDYLKEVGYDSFPTTWDDFFTMCDKLKAKGITPISLHTDETAWCPMLVAEAYVANDADARTFYLDSPLFPTNYNIPTWTKQMELIKRMFSYSTSDAVGGTYAMAANNFCSGKTAMIPNGPWMATSLYDPTFAPKGFADKVGYALYPGNVMISDLGMTFGDGVSVDGSKEAQQGGIAWEEFMASPAMVRYDGVMLGNLSTSIPLTASDKAKLNGVMKEYAYDVTQVKQTLPYYQGRMDPVSQNTVFTNELPLYVTGKITTKQMLDKMTAAAQQYAKDNSGS